MPYKKIILAVMTTKLRLREILKEENCISQSTVHSTSGPRAEKVALKGYPFKAWIGERERERERERHNRSKLAASALGVIW